MCLKKNHKLCAFKIYVQKSSQQQIDYMKKILMWLNDRKVDQLTRNI